MYDAICVLGTGNLAVDCCRLLAKKGYSSTLYDTNDVSSWLLKNKCAKTDGVEYKWLDKKGTFDDILDQKGRILLISAINPYIIPDRVLKLNGLTAINLHHALLPYHPGRNAEAWAIYEQDERAGITWHFVSNEVDGGDIIASAGVIIDKDMTTWKLLKIQSELAYKEFENFCDDLLKGTVVGKKQERHADIKMHFLREKPNDGILDPRWPADKISAFLRSMDYGPARTMGYPVIILNGEEKKIVRYSIAESDKEEAFLTDDGKLYIRKDGIEINMVLG